MQTFYKFQIKKYLHVPKQYLYLFLTSIEAEWSKMELKKYVSGNKVHFIRSKYNCICIYIHNCKENR